MKKFITISLLTLIFSVVRPVAAADNLISNGSFESPPVTDAGNWQIFNGSDISPWMIVGTADPGDVEGLEYHKNGIYLGSTASDGTQYVELDGYYPVKLYQEIDACSSGKYQILFDYAPRPGHAENKLEVKFAEEKILDDSLSAISPFSWSTYNDEVTGPTSDKVTLSFEETGTNDQLGMFLDNIRVECVVPPDADDDGVLNEQDLCENTDLDDEQFSDPWGVHRWHYDGSVLIQQPNKKNKGTQEPKSMEFTYGCSCYQILEKLNDAGLGQFGGHYKFGCSTSIIEEFNKDMNDGILDGRYFIESVAVPASKSTDTMSQYPLMDGLTYYLKASGTAFAGDSIEFDARYARRPYATSTTWTDTVPNYVSYGVTLLDLLFNGSTPWGDYNDSHEYEYMTIGDGNNATFKIYDIYYPNNTGALTVDIYAQL